MDFKRNDLFTPEDFHGNGGAGLKFRQALHVFLDVLDGLPVYLLNDVTATDSGIMCRLSCHHDVSAKAGNAAGAHNIGHET